MINNDDRAAETTVRHETYSTQEWTIEILDDAMAFTDWRDAFDEAAELLREHPDGTGSVHFIDPNLMVIKVVYAVSS